MEAFLISTGIVALAEIGDKTQVATIALAAQYQAFYAVVRVLKSRRWQDGVDSCLQSVTTARSATGHLFRYWRQAHVR